MFIRDPVTITFRFERPATRDALVAAINTMVCAVPAGPDGNIKVRMSFEGIPDDLAAALETGFAIGKAQIAAKASHRNRK